MTRQELTDKQQAVYEFIRDRIIETRLPPTSKEIGREFGLRTSNGVMCHVNALERKGWIKRDGFCYR